MGHFLYRNCLGEDTFKIRKLLLLDEVASFFSAYFLFHSWPLKGVNDKNGNLTLNYCLEIPDRRVIQISYQSDKSFFQ